ncbi:MAG: hypothetical protein B6D72_16075 [gamma proteobacterium symbiont of Ctena orbiculata]|nr:MAG: hypothetical protein B6D72_16075 [gamma proteobacterium symbiont of Ctena orbiculata]PVV24953.1 MAG: hypothetical protein B6D74_04210 [gamma proteobacterium symbiont of Ctena orbiculata]
MKQVVREIALPIFNIEMEFTECRFDTIEAIVSYFEEQVRKHRAARYIATFNHLQHTTGLTEGIVADDIEAAYNIVFCFGFSLQDAEQLATRPRSIGVCHCNGRISVSFVEAPMPVANALMEQWAKSLLLDEKPHLLNPGRSGQEGDALPAP